MAAKWTSEMIAQREKESSEYEAGRPARELAAAVSAIKAEAAKRILARYPQYKQMNAALGLYPVDYTDAMVAYINAVRAASDTIEAAVAMDPSIDPTTDMRWPA